VIFGGVTVAPRVWAEGQAPATANAAPSASSAMAAPPGVPPPPAGYKYVQLNSAAAAAPPPVPAPAFQPALELPYVDGAPVPVGYRVREEPRHGLVTAGYIVTAIPYAIGAMAALSANFKNSSGYMMVPFAGPWLTMGRRNYSDCSADSNARNGLGCVADVLLVMGLIMDGIIQAGGGSLLLTGYLATTKKLVRNDVAMTMSPGLVGTGYGLGAAGTF
jgi:hypothetical protein